MLPETPAQAPKPRVIVELQPDGSIVIESYSAGQRHREHISRYFTGNAVLDELSRQKREMESAAEAKRLKQEREEAARHRRVWWGVANGTIESRGHGIAFANKTVGHISRTPKEPKPTPLPTATVDLL